tara:strand:+ start:845 stop:1087 length:243 start_codon:yes stop_codon:yes gene_type:complete
MTKTSEALKTSTDALKQPKEPELIGVPVQFLRQVIVVIDQGVKRGAFTGKEMSAIGAMRDGTEAVLIQHEAKKEEAKVQS